MTVQKPSNSRHANFVESLKGLITTCDYFTTPDNKKIRYKVWLCDKEKRCGTIVLLEGRGEFLEKYSETATDLIGKGFDVYGFDWRGQGLSTRSLPNRKKGFVANYDNYIKDLDQFVSSIVRPEAVSPIIILAHSMGGHLALRFMHDHPDSVDRAVLVSPMIDIVTSPFPMWFVRSIAWFACKTVFGPAYTIGSSDHPFLNEKFENNRLTSDPERFLVEKKEIKKNPDLDYGDVTYRWLAATFNSIDTLKKKRYAQKIKAPVLIICGGSDTIVSVQAQKDICSVMKNCRFVEIDGSRHEILMENDSIRFIFWREFDSFVNISHAC